MNCADFEKRFDLYIDEMLAGADLAAAHAHLAACPACETAVTRYQQTRAILSTAVADIATAVDVSGVWAGVERALVADGTISDRPAVVAPETSPSTLADRWADWRDGWVDAVGLNPVGYVWRVGFAGGASAVAAGLLFVSLQGVDGSTAGNLVASAGGGAQSVASDSARRHYVPVRASDVRPASTPWPGVGEGAARAALGTLNLVVEPKTTTQNARAARAVLASRNQSEPVRVDSVRSAPGHDVTTWTDPRTRNRVIWVAPGKTSPPARAAEQAGYGR